MVRPQRAAVVPHALSEISGDPFPVEEMLAPYLGQAGLIALVGPHGAGKTTALQHVAAAMPGGPLVFDDTPLDVIEQASRTRLVVYSCERPSFSTHIAILRLAPWGRDEAIEYLMARHPAQCGEVMRRLAADADIATLEGNPELYRTTLDRMAAGAPGVLAALAAVATRAAPPDRILDHAVVRDLRRAHEVSLQIREDGECVALRNRLPRRVLRGAAVLLADAPDAREALDRICAGTPDARQPMAASLLLALDPAWTPRGIPALEGAYLGGAAWRGVQLKGADLHKADLAGADLDAAVLDGADARGASFRGARLRGASVQAARLASADLRGADLAGAMLKGAILRAASLLDAQLRGADLSEATIFDAKIRGADFSGANLSGAQCRGLDLREAKLDGANFSAAYLELCHLDGVHLRAARFDHAHLEGADLTGSDLPRACFRDAALRGVKVADVSWVAADLRGADLTGAIFHMGSSRGGLVGSYLASEGTRTGFYTDDYEEQHFKSPEEIRKANLRGADLRGARVLHTDFYLVDLRDAVYDDVQEKHFRRCRAILRTKTP